MEEEIEREKRKEEVDSPLHFPTTDSSIPNKNEHMENDNNDNDEKKDSHSNALKGASSSAPPLQERPLIELVLIITGSYLLSFNAGFVNGLTYLNFNLASSHVTGTSTKLGLALASNDSVDIQTCFGIILSFIFGSFICGGLSTSESFNLDLSYGPIFLVGALFFLLAFISIETHPDSLVYCYFAAMACGLQNAMTSKYR